MTLRKCPFGPQFVLLIAHHWSNCLMLKTLFNSSYPLPTSFFCLFFLALFLIDFNFAIPTNIFLFKRFGFSKVYMSCTQVLFEYSSVPKAFQPERLIAAVFWYHHNNIYITCAGLPLCRERFSGEVELLLRRPGPRPGFRSQRSPPPLLCIRTRSCAIGSFCIRVLITTRAEYRVHECYIRVLL